MYVHRDSMIISVPSETEQTALFEREMRHEIAAAMA